MADSTGNSNTSSLAAIAGLGTGLTVATTAVSVISNFKKAQSERQALLNQQALRTLEVNEMRRRQDINQELLHRKLNNTYSETMGQFAQTASGAAGSATAGAFSGELLSNITKELERAKLEADYEISIRQQEADAAGAQAAAVNRGAALGAVSSVLGGASDIYSIYKPRN